MSEDLELKLIGIDEFALGNERQILGTTLGSCVSIILWDEVRKVGGINHYLLPDDMRRANVKPVGLSHGIIEELLNAMVASGSKLQDLEAVIVGGADSAFDHYQVGRKNLDIARAMLKAHAIEPVRVSGGGNYSRKITFYVGEGRLVIHKLALNQRLKQSEETIKLGGRKR